MSLLWASFLGLLKRFSGPIMLALLLALLGLGGWAGLQKVKATLEVNKLEQEVSKQKLETAKVQMEYLSAQAIGALQLAAKRAENAGITLAWQTKFDTAEKERLHESQRLQATLAAVRSERDSLYKRTLEATSADPAIASGQPIDPGAFRRVDATARAFGGLLQTCDRLSDGLGQDAEKLASQVRGLQTALTGLRNNPALQKAQSQQLVATDP